MNPLAIDREQELTAPEHWDSEWAVAASPRSHRGRQSPTAPLARFSRRGASADTDLLLGIMLDQCRVEQADVLEIGCAPGQLIARMHRLRPGYRYHGVDYSERGLEAATQRLRESAIPCQLHLADIRTFSPPQQYDLVVSFGLVEHFVDPLDVIRDHVRMCKPGGHVAVSVPNYRGRLVRSVIRILDPAALDIHNLDIMSRPALCSLLQTAGLADVRTGAVGRPRFRTRSTRCDLAPRIVRAAVRSWNLLANISPVVPAVGRWALWAAGTVPPAPS